MTFNIKHFNEISNQTFATEPYTIGFTYYNNLYCPAYIKIEQQ